MMRTSKDGNRSTETTFEVRPLDAHGDAQDVLRHETITEARATAAKLIAPAWVIERHTSRRPAHTSAAPDIYVTVASGGETSALEEGGWR